MSEPVCDALLPFGLLVHFAPGSTWDDVDIGALTAWGDAHRVVVLRGLSPWPSKEAMVDGVRRLGYLQAWGFGGIHDLKVDPDADNYLYTKNAVPLHWDGAFADESPRWLVFQCVDADDADKGGETVFVDAVKAWDDATDGQRARWDGEVRLSTEKKAYYGGTVTRRMAEPHESSGQVSLRFAEPVRDLNPVAVVTSPHDVVDELSAHLCDPALRLEHRWRTGDIVIADNHALLHGRNAYAENSAGTRRIWRANVLSPERPWWQPWADSYKLRRPEFFKAEIPILLIPGVLLAPSWGALLSAAFVGVAVLFALLIQLGDIINCFADRDTDRVFKTHLSEAIRRLGPVNIKAQLVAMSVLLLLVAVALSVFAGRPWWILGGTLLGGVLAAGYSTGPLPMKQSGVFQIASYLVLLFIGPMGLISGAFADRPSLHIIGVAFFFGLLQTCPLLVNNAEDLREDRAADIKTATSALGRHRVFIVALSCALVGTAGLLVLLWPSGWLGLCGVLLFAASGLSTIFWVARLARLCVGADMDTFDRHIKKAGRWVPRFLTANAWTTLALALSTRPELWAQILD